MIVRPQRPRRLLPLLFALANYCVMQGAWAAQKTDLRAAWHAARSYDATFFAAKATDLAAQEKKAKGDVLSPQVLLTTSATQAAQAYRPGNATSTHRHI